MNQKLVRRDVDLSHLPALTKEQKAQLGVLENQAESEIDHCDIAPLTDAFWKSAEPGRFYKPR
jgi:hypothetical protein